MCVAVSLVAGMAGCVAANPDNSGSAAGPPPSSASQPEASPGDCTPDSPPDLIDSTADPEPDPASPDLSGLLPADRRTTWNPGLNAVGGIPHRTEVSTTLAPSGGDDTEAIQAALDSAAADEVVQLEPGTFHISGEGLMLTTSGVTLRGSGPGSTLLVKEPGSSSPVINAGTRWFKYVQPTDLVTDGVQVSTSVTLAADPGLEPGEIVAVDQLTDPELTVWSQERSPQGDPSRGWFGRYDRPLGQVMEVESVDGTTVTFTTPFHISFQAALSAQLVRFSDTDNGAVVPAVKYAGIEDLYVCGGEGGDGGGNIHLFGTAYSWVKNVESAGSLGGSVNLDGTFRSVLRDSYLHSTRNPNPGGDGYGISINQYAADNLVENNISWNFNKVMVMRTTGGGNVIGYNYMEDGWGADYPDYPEIGLNASHMTTPHHELFEGNQSWNFGGESVWGNSIYITAFRNDLTGLRRSVAPLQLTDDSNRHVIGLYPGHWWYSFVGNVLGSPDQDPAPASAFEYDWSGTDDGSTVPMWKLGYDGEDTAPQDTAVVETTIRHGNFDYVTNSTVWEDGLSQDLPPSFYLASKPDFFGDSSWPWVTPEDGASPVAALPARERFDSLH